MQTTSSDVCQAVVHAGAEQLRHSLNIVQHCVHQLDEDQLWWRSDDSMNSIANLLIHLTGNVRQWLVCGLSSATDHRRRQSEFDDRSHRDRAELMRLLEDTVVEACRVIEGQSALDLIRPRRVQEFDFTGASTMFDSIAHFQGHAQEIVYRTRKLLGEKYQFRFIPQEQQESTPPNPPTSTEHPSEMNSSASLSPQKPIAETPSTTMRAGGSNPRVRGLVEETRRLKKQAEAALQELSDEVFFRTPSPNANSIALIIKHVAGNLRSRWSHFLTSDGEKPDRNRDGEFELLPEDTRNNLMHRWEIGWKTVFDSLTGIPDDQLDRIVTIRSEPHTVYQAAVRNLAHTAYHVGQIVYLRRMHQPESPWLTIAPGQSDQYVQGKYLK